MCVCVERERGVTFIFVIVFTKRSGHEKSINVSYDIRFNLNKGKMMLIILMLFKTLEIVSHFSGSSE